MRIYLEIAPGRHGGVAAHAHAPAAPGLIALGANAASALRDLEAAARMYRAVLLRRGLRSDASRGRGPWRLAGTVAGHPFWRSGQAAALLPSDLPPPSDRRVRRVLRVVRALRAEHLARLGQGDDDAFERRPGRGRRTLRETLDHLANCEWWYCSRLDDGLPEPGRECPRQTHARLAHLLDSAERWLLALPAAARRRVVVPNRFPSADRREAWTAGKVLRRLAEHEFEHLRAVSKWRPEPMRNRAVPRRGVGL